MSINLTSVAQRGQTKALSQPIVPSLQQPLLGTACFLSLLTLIQLVIPKLIIWYEHTLFTAGTLSLWGSVWDRSDFYCWLCSFPAALQPSILLSFTVTPESQCLYHINHLGHCIFNGLCIIKEAAWSKGAGYATCFFHCLWQCGLVWPDSSHTHTRHIYPLFSLWSFRLLYGVDSQIQKMDWQSKVYHNATEL